jgi:hypothetical protein
VFCDLVPKAAENFLALAAAGAYDGLLFHRNMRGEEAMRLSECDSRKHSHNIKTTADIWKLFVETLGMVTSSRCMNLSTYNTDLMER